ncbi:sulfurase [Polynucleobacter sp. JS-Safj-400b-B2]|nr:sulfurase [Polynucleobacter sp. JS-Safj-400b-B2]
MRSIDRIEAIAEIGLENDRYALGIGAFSTTAVGKVRDITFISQAAIDEANSALAQMNEPSYDGSQTRRNVVLTNISAQDLNDLVGKQFQIGDALFEGTELCNPCKRPAKLLGRKIFMQVFENKGGIRAKVIQSGVLNIGAKLVVL